MKRQQQIALKSLDQQLSSYDTLRKIEIPHKGWINAIRKVLGISLRQLGDRLDMRSQSVAEVEQREASGGITLNNLHEVGKALRLKLVYGFVPIDGSLENLIERRAFELANEIVSRTNTTMTLEDQQLDKEKVNAQIKDLAAELKHNRPRHLWDL